MCAAGLPNPRRQPTAPASARRCAIAGRSHDRRVIEFEERTEQIAGIVRIPLAATDDGQIAAADAIGTSEISGRRVLKIDLKQCEATGRWVLRKFLKTCPVSERRMIDEALVRCGVRCQTVSVAVVKQDRCLACRSLGAVRKEQPRLARVLGEYPRLDGWRRWKMSETATAYVLEAESFWRRLLLVLDKESLGLLHIASASRWSNQWVEVPEPQRREWLGG